MDGQTDGPTHRHELDEIAACSLPSMNRFGSGESLLRETCSALKFLSCLTQKNGCNSGASPRQGSPPGSRTHLLLPLPGRASPTLKHPPPTASPCTS